MEWSSMPDTVTATSTKSPNKPTTATVSDKFRDEDAKSSNTPPARAEPASTAVDINKNAEAATLPVPEETPPCSNKIDSTTINKVIQMYVEYNTGVMKKCKAGESQSSNPKKKASSSDYTIQDAKAYFDLVFKPRLLQLRNLEISAKFQSTFTRDALIMLTHQDDEVCCENCGMSNFEFWCPCRVSREGERLIANVAKLFEDKLHHIEFARQEITKMFQAKKKLQNQDSKSCKDKKAKSKKAKSDDDDDFVVRPSKSKKLTVVLRGKHFLRPRALPSRKSKKSKDWIGNLDFIALKIFIIIWAFNYLQYLYNQNCRILTLASINQNQAFFHPPSILAAIKNSKFAVVKKLKKKRLLDMYNTM